VKANYLFTEKLAIRLRLTAVSRTLVLFVSSRVAEYVEVPKIMTATVTPALKKDILHCIKWQMIQRLYYFFSHPNPCNWDWHITEANNLI